MIEKFICQVSGIMFTHETRLSRSMGGIFIEPLGQIRLDLEKFSDTGSSLDITATVFKHSLYLIGCSIETFKP